MAAAEVERAEATAARPAAAGAPMWGPVRLPRTFTALRHASFRLFYFGQLVSLVGTWMQNTAQGWLVVLLAAPGASLSQAAAGRAAGGADAANLYLGVIAAAGSLPVLLGSLYGGVVADRCSKRTIIVLTQAAQMLLAFALTLLILYGHVRIWHVVALALLLGVTNAFDVPARQAFVVEMVGRDDLPNAIALNSSIFNAARAFGPAAAGLLLAAMRGQPPEVALARCFLYNGLSYVAVIAGLLLMRGDYGPQAASADTHLAQVREVVAYLKAHRPALLLIGLVATFSVCMAPQFVLLPSLARFTLHTDARQFGILLSCQGAGALLGALTIATASDNPRKGRVLTLSSLVFPGMVVLLALSRAFWLSCLLVALVGFVMICFLATANPLLQGSIPDSLRGRVMGVYAIMLMGLTPVGSLWGSAVARMAGAPAAIAAGALTLGAVSLAVAIRYPALRRAGRTLPETL